MSLPTYKKRVNPNSPGLHASNKYYQPGLNNQEWNSASGGNCVWYAYGRMLEVYSEAPKALREAHPWPGFFSSNGNGMVSAAKSRGFKTGNTPLPGAIISWAGPSSAGHVAFVEQVNKDSSGKIVSFEVSQSSWSYGNMASKTFTISDKGASAYGTFLGFAYNPITFANPDGTVVGEANEGEESGFGINFQKRASKLISSDSYSFLKQEQKPKYESNFVKTFKESMTKFSSNALTSYSGTISKAFSLATDKIAEAFNDVAKEVPKIVKQQSFLSVAENVIEAPFIEATIGGFTIGSYRGSIDIYPNYISSLQVSKQNGVINQYTLNLVHQIRAGDDANLLDELLSTVNYSKISIKYGDSNSGTYFRDDEAIITNVRMNRSYTNMSVSYTVEATSAGQLVKTYSTNFPAVTDKPSNVLNNLLYSSGQVSDILLDTFPGMKNKTFVNSNNLIPSNDAVVEIDAKSNTNILDYINYLVGSMSNQLSGNEVIRNSTYYSTFIDNDSSNPDGAYIKINEVQADIDPYSITNRIYNITVGYPDDIVYSFTVDDTNEWELLYSIYSNNNENSPEYYYSITDNGDVSKYYSPAISSSMEVLSEINKNWWTQMVKFPITAQLTIKGLLKPIMLMDYININVVFYGQTHITSGVYAITGQTDFLSGSGYKTTLSLVRVSNSGVAKS